METNLDNIDEIFENLKKNIQNRYDKINEYSSIVAEKNGQIDTYILEINKQNDLIQKQKEQIRNLKKSLNDKQIEINEYLNLIQEKNSKIKRGKNCIVS